MGRLLFHVLPVPWVGQPAHTPSPVPRNHVAQPGKTASISSRRHSVSLLHPLYRLARGANEIAQAWRDGLTREEREGNRRVEERKQILSLRMTGATTHQEWEDAARQLDALEGNDAWKMDPSSTEYNATLIAERLRELEEARTSCNIGRMIHLVRTALSRDLGGMGNMDLYRHSHIGTKSLIEKYVDAATSTIDALVEQSAIPGALPDGFEHRDLLEGLLCSRQRFGRSALLLSGGATFGMSHIGVLKAMYDADVLPRIVSGASAGSIVVSVLCTRTDEEVPAVLKAFPNGPLDVFEENGKEDSFGNHLKRLFTEGSWSDIKHLTRVMRGILGDLTFQEAYNRTRRICNICVSSASLYELPRLLNYVTAPNVMIWSAVAASCSVPLVFNAAPLLVKDPATGNHVPWNPAGQDYIDGSVDNDLPMTRLAEMFNVTHFIISQVNPHIVPFLDKDDHIQTGPQGAEARQNARQGPDWLQALTTLAKDEALHRLHFLAELGIFPNLFTKLQSVLSQKYSGHINIHPQIDPQDLPRILKNPNAEFMVRACLTGERATWPKLSRIRYRCATELALDKAVHALRARVVFSKSQVDLRRLVTGIEEPNVPAQHGTLQDGDGVGGAAVPSGDQAAGALDQMRRRRNSGSNLQVPQYHRLMMQQLEVPITDDKTEEEERFEMTLRRGEKRLQPGGKGSPTKTRIKRNARSQLELSFDPGPLTSPLPAVRRARDGERGLEFDFSRPLTPKAKNRPDRLFQGSGRSCNEEADGGLEEADGGLEEAESGPEETAQIQGLGASGHLRQEQVVHHGADYAQRGAEIQSPAEEDASNPDHTWDADVESHTEASVMSDTDELEERSLSGLAKA